MMPKNNYLFDFSSSYDGGGLNILMEYLDFFESQGGAIFVVNMNLKERLNTRYTNNELIFVALNKFKRFINNSYYLKTIPQALSKPEVYFSFGIPIRKKIAKYNWFHLSSLLPINSNWGYLEWYKMIKIKLLRYRLKQFSKNIDILSADSQDAINQTLTFYGHGIPQSFVLKNGINQSIIDVKYNRQRQKDNTATTIGTYPYKDIIRLYHFFKHLQQENKIQKLKIIGHRKYIPSIVKNDVDVEVMGVLPFICVMEELIKSEVYISTSKVENSSIASLEGLFLCGTVYLSTIGSHREMLDSVNVDYQRLETEHLGSFYKSSTEIDSQYIKELSWNKLNMEFYVLLKTLATS